MAWNPNEKNSWAWLTKQASEHGGVEKYIDDILKYGIEIGQNKTSKEYLMKFLLVVPILLIGGAAIGVASKIAYDKNKQKLQAQKELQQKSDLAKEELINGVKAAENSLEESAESQIREEEEE